MIAPWARSLPGAGPGPWSGVIPGVAAGGRGGMAQDAGEDGRHRPERAALGRAAPALRRRRWLGPGLMTGAADDDPSGILTYAQAGAQLGFALCWLMPLLYTLMAVTQEISARIGRVTGQGLAGTIGQYYSRPLLRTIVLVVVFANTINLGSDLGAMGDVAALLTGGPRRLYAAGFGLLCAGLQIGLAYERYARLMRWAALTLLAYFATAFAVDVPWASVAYHTIIPHWPRQAGGLLLLAAVAGTTISPYNFFWQAALEAEEAGRGARAGRQRAAVRDLRRLRVDTYAGMALANLLAFAVMVTAGATLHVWHAGAIPTAAAAAAALRPLAGPLAGLLFSAGILASGFLAVPMLAGSAAIALAETLGFPHGFDRRPAEAPAFYATLAALTLAGTLLSLVPGIDPIRALTASAILNGVAVVPVLILMMRLATRPEVMGPLALPRAMALVGWLTTAIMTAVGLAAIAALFLS